MSPVSVLLGWTTLLSAFYRSRYQIGLSKDPRQSHQRSAQATLVPLIEFKRYLLGLEKDLSRMSKKYSNREIAQGVGFVAAGIHEALNYLDIVRKVIEKTERAVARKNAVSENTSLSSNSL